MQCRGVGDQRPADRQHQACVASVVHVYRDAYNRPNRPGKNDTRRSIVAERYIEVEDLWTLWLSRTESTRRYRSCPTEPLRRGCCRSAFAGSPRPPVARPAITTICCRPWPRSGMDVRGLVLGGDRAARETDGRVEAFVQDGAGFAARLMAARRAIREADPDLETRPGRLALRDVRLPGARPDPALPLRRAFPRAVGGGSSRRRRRQRLGPLQEGHGNGGLPQRRPLRRPVGSLCAMFL